VAILWLVAGRLQFYGTYKDKLCVECELAHG
jgi:hypothetical protein